MKICTTCGNKLKNEEKKCPVCKTKSKDFPIVNDGDTERMQEIIDAVKTKNSGQAATSKKRKGKGCLVVIVVVVLLGVIGIATQMGAGDNPEDISLEEFNKIQTGMTYEQVKEIIGSDGELMSDVDIGAGEQYHTVIYMWYGNKTTGANANFTFQGNKLVSKAQVGLK